MTTQAFTLRVAEHGRAVVAAEAAAIGAIVVDEQFVAAVALLLRRKGRVLCCGLGKSLDIARKVAATFAVLGIPAVAIHAVDALHGDIGPTGADDLALVFSRSGETAEVLACADALAQRDIVRIAVTSDSQSRLGRSSQVVLQLPPVPDLGPSGVVPTTSAAAMLAIGDALCVVVAAELGVDAGAVARAHPGGAVGALAAAAAAAPRTPETPGPLTLEHFQGRHAGSAALLVCGIGPSLDTAADVLREHRNQFVIIAVNDFEARSGIVPDYLVVANSPAEFAPERWRRIASHCAPYTFSQHQLPLQGQGRLIRFTLGTYAASDFSDPHVLNYSRESTFIAAALALHMGARRVGLLGVDISAGHSLARERDVVDANYVRLRDWAAARGRAIVNLGGSVSRLASLTRGRIDDFTSTEAPAAASIAAP